MKKPRRKKPKASPKPRNVAAKALREGQFRPKVMADPKAYKRHPRHQEPLVSQNGEDENE
jgi:hypothetical protein